jgi:hypothetical protein
MPLDTAHGPTENGRGVKERPFEALGKRMDAGRRINPGLRRFVPLAHHSDDTPVRPSHLLLVLGVSEVGLHDYG